MLLQNKIFPAAFLIMFSYFACANNDTLTIKLKLANVSKVLTFNQQFVPGNSVEYLWEVLIDSDNNFSTGDANGFDVGLILSNTKLPGSISYTGTIISGSDHYTLLYNGSQSTYANALTVFFGDNDSCLHIKALKAYPEIATITQGSRIAARTYYHGDAGTSADETNTGVITGVITDPDGDAPHSFIDILSVSVENLVTDICENKSKAHKNLFFPNPTSGKIYISKKNELYEISDFSGNKILSVNADEIDLSEYSEGVYFIRNVNTGFSEKLILRK